MLSMTEMLSFSTGSSRLLAFVLLSASASLAALGLGMGLGLTGVVLGERLDVDTAGAGAVLSIFLLGAVAKGFVRPRHKRTQLPRWWWRNGAPIAAVLNGASLGLVYPISSVSSYFPVLVLFCISLQSVYGSTLVVMAITWSGLILTMRGAVLSTERRDSLLFRLALGNGTVALARTLVESHSSPTKEHK
jgi:hypothetical protein